MADTTVSAFYLYGWRVPETDIGAVITEDETSQDDYGIYAETITADDLQDAPLAEGLGGWLQYRYGNPKARPSLTFVNRFPSQLQRDVSDRITLTFGLEGVAGRDFLIRSLETTVTQSGAEWMTEYGLEEAPTLDSSTFTVDGTAAQGVGGTGILLR